MKHMEQLRVNGKEYSILKLLGKGKGGYSYLALDGDKKVVLKQIHHEPVQSMLYTALLMA